MFVQDTEELLAEKKKSNLKKNYSKKGSNFLTYVNFLKKDETKKRKSTDLELNKKKRAPTRRGWLLLRLLFRLVGPRRRQPPTGPNRGLNLGTGRVGRTSTIIPFDMSSIVKYIMIFMTRCGNNVWASKIECPRCGSPKLRRN